MKYPVLYLEATTYDNVLKHSKVLNRRALERYLWVHIPDYLSCSFELYEFYEIQTHLERPLELEAIERDHQRPWFRIDLAKVDTNAGQHIYRLHLINRFTDDVISLYFCYEIQDDDPAQPYNYMKKIRHDWCDKKSRGPWCETCKERYNCEFYLL